METKNKQEQAIQQASRLIQKFEGCKLKAYQCPAGHWTIGWGETKVYGIKQGMRWTQKRADDVLKLRIVELSISVRKACPSLENYPSRLAACISLAYNIGISNFSGSSVAKYIRRGEYRAAADAFGMWIYAGGKRLDGLMSRRRAEREVFLKETL